MKRAVNRSVSLAIAIILALTLVTISPLHASAAPGSIIYVDNMLYKILTEDGNTGTVQVGDGLRAVIPYSVSGTVTVPETIAYGGKLFKVTAIGSLCFRYCTGLTGVTIPDSVTYIGTGAFSYCSGLTGVAIPGSVTSIGNNAFQNCYGLTSVTIPDSVTSIGNDAFQNCSSLTGVTIPDSVTSIGRAAFMSCKNLAGVSIGNHLQIIGDAAFDSCESLTDVTIPDSVTSIGIGAFWSCKNLASVSIGSGVTQILPGAFEACHSLRIFTVSDLNASFSSDGAILFDKQKKVLVSYPTAYGDFTIPENVQQIEDSAFCNCINLTSVTIGSQVKSIGPIAFLSCTSLKSIYFEGDAPITSSAFKFVPSDVIAYVYTDAEGFELGSDGKWKYLNIVRRERPQITYLSIGGASTLVSGLAAYIPVEISGKGLEGRQLVLSIINSDGVAVYQSLRFDAADSFSKKLSLDKAELSLPAGRYTFRASVEGTDVKAEAPFTIAPNSADYWDMSILKGSYNSKDALEIRFPDVGYERQFLGEVFVNNVKYSAVISGNSLLVPTAPLSGELSVKVTGIKYPALFPSYRFTFIQTVTL